MKKQTIILFVTLVIVIVSIIIFSSRNIVTPYGYGFRAKKINQNQGEIPNFSLLDQNGVFHELYRYSDAKAVVIISQGNDCPIIQKFIIRLNELQKKFKDQGIVFLMLNPNTQDNRESIIEEAKSYNMSIPILMDPSQVVAEKLGITRTAEASVILPSNWSLVYRGAIDDRLSYGVDKQVARNNYLEDVLTAIVNEDEINVQAMPAKGCLISYVKKKTFSYQNEVAPIIRNKCLICHSEEIGYRPYLDSYNKFKSWSEMIKETIVTDRMPPFSADLHYGEYQNDSSLTPEEKRLLVSWIDAGMPRELGTDLLEQSTTDNKLKGVIGSTQKVYSVSMKKEALIPASGNTEYQYEQLGEAAPRDMYISVIHVKSTNPRQIHHASVMVVSQPLSFYENMANDIRKSHPSGDANKKIDGDVPLFLLGAIQKNDYEQNPNYIRMQVWTAGRPQPQVINSKAYFFIPKGAYIILESHYMGTGKVETEKTTIDFYEKRELPEKLGKLKTLMLFDSKFTIPANVKDFAVETGEVVLKKDINVLNYLGHLHMRGKAISVSYTSPDNKVKKTIMSIPNFYYGWHTGAGLINKTPQVFKKGSKLKAVCHYDNSGQNPNNPDPSKTVRFGQRVDRTEMCMVNMGYYTND